MRARAAAALLFQFKTPKAVPTLWKLKNPLVSTYFVVFYMSREYTHTHTHTHTTLPLVINLNEFVFSLLNSSCIYGKTMGMHTLQLLAPLPPISSPIPESSQIENAVIKLKKVKGETSIY